MVTIIAPSSPQAIVTVEFEGSLTVRQVLQLHPDEGFRLEVEDGRNLHVLVNGVESDLDAPVPAGAQISAGTKVVRNG